jgi:hypothetical protein
MRDMKIIQQIFQIVKRVMSISPLNGTPWREYQSSRSTSEAVSDRIAIHFSIEVMTLIRTPGSFHKRKVED